MKLWSVPIWVVVTADDMEEAVQTAYRIVKLSAKRYHKVFEIGIGEPYEEKEKSHVGA